MKRTGGAVPLMVLALAACGDRGGGTGVPGAGRDATAPATEAAEPISAGPVQPAPPPRLNRAELTALDAYPFADVTDRAATADAKGGGAGIVSFETRDPPPDVIAFYRAAAARAGYAVEGQVDLGETALIGGKRRDGTGFQLTVTREGGRSKATLITGRNP